MMKKIILAAVSALSIVGIDFLVTQGFVLEGRLPFDIKVLNYKEIMAKGDNLTSKINQIVKINTTQIVEAENRISEEKDSFEEKKATYEKLESNASEAEIAEANKKQEYLLDYLWIVIGNYANDNNVKFKMTTDDKNLRINFDITGSYVSIINFIYDIENDTNLNFSLNGIAIQGSTTDSTKASFSVDGITVKTSNTAR